MVNHMIICGVFSTPDLYIRVALPPQMLRAGPGSLGRHDWLELWRPRDHFRLLDMEFFQDASVACLAAAPEAPPGKGGLLLEIIPYNDPANVHIVEVPNGHFINCDFAPVTLILMLTSSIYT